MTILLHEILYHDRCLYLPEMADSSERPFFFLCTEAKMLHAFSGEENAIKFIEKNGRHVDDIHYQSLNLNEIIAYKKGAQISDISDIEQLDIFRTLMIDFFTDAGTDSWRLDDDIHDMLHDVFVMHKLADWKLVTKDIIRNLNQPAFRNYFQELITRFEQYLVIDKFACDENQH